MGPAGPGVLGCGAAAVPSGLIRRSGPSVGRSRQCLCRGQTRTSKRRASLQSIRPGVLSPIRTTTGKSVAISASEYESEIETNGAVRIMGTSHSTFAIPSAIVLPAQLPRWTRQSPTERAAHYSTRVSTGRSSGIPSSVLTRLGRILSSLANLVTVSPVVCASS